MGKTSDHKGLEGESAEELFAKVALGDSVFMCSRSRAVFVNPHSTAWQYPRVETCSAMRRTSIAIIVLQISLNAVSSWISNSIQLCEHLWVIASNAQPCVSSSLLEFRLTRSTHAQASWLAVVVNSPAHPTIAPLPSPPNVQSSRQRAMFEAVRAMRCKSNASIMLHGSFNAARS